MLHSVALTLRCLTLQEHTGQLSCALLSCASRVLTTALDHTSSEADLNGVVSVCLECACLVAKACSDQVTSSGPEDQHAFASAASLLLHLLQNPMVAKIGKSVQEQMSILLDSLLVWIAALSGTAPDSQSATSSSNAVCALINVMLQCAEVALEPAEPTPGQVSVCQWLLKGLHKVVTTVPEYVTQKLHFRTQNFVVKCMRASNVTIVSMAVQNVASYVRTAHQYAADKAQSQRFSATCNYIANFMSEVAALFFTPHNGDSKRIALRVATLQLMCSLLQSRSTVLGDEGKAALLRLVLQLAVGVSARLGKGDEALSTSIGNALLGLAASARNIFKQQVRSCDTVLQYCLMRASMPPKTNSRPEQAYTVVTRSTIS